MSAVLAADPAFRAIALGPYAGQVERRPDGAVLLRVDQPLRPGAVRYTEPLLRWARERPRQAYLAQRGADGDWRHLNYADALAQVRSLGQALLQRGLGPERPLLILSENDLESALLSLAAAHVGVPFVPLSPAYSLLSKDGERLRHALALLTPGLVFAADADRYGRAIEACVAPDIELLFTRGSLAGRRCGAVHELLATVPGPQVDLAHRAIGPDTIVKFLFTSGSTKLPKAVINTHRMMCANQQMHAQCYPFLDEQPPVLLDWMPWHHTAGGNLIAGMVLYCGGTLYLDDGKPTPDDFAKTVRNLREIAPTIYFTVPKGLEMLVRAMQDDSGLRDHFFSRLRLIFPAGAALSAPLKAAVDQLAVAACGVRIPMTMGLGMTETAPFALSAHLPDWQAGLIGLPAPGVDVKLVPVGDKLEVRYRGPNVTPGYWRQPELTDEAFDDEGYFRSGDAARFIDEARPARGLRFDGRIAEDFKLISGTWANVGSLRGGVIGAGAPYIQDVVITGHDRDTLGMLVFLLPAAAAMPAPARRAWLQALLDRLAAQATGSSQRIVHAMEMDEPASMELGEATDKGSINQRTVLRLRAHLVELLYAPPGDPRVLHARPTTNQEAV
ncbi:MAG TPA: feruloyl-CoA synthase [Duganella sp.]|uniref:feruloyl-CoA synthase n=1 Tax=Duganella sp. TaxID=1904440 RepID=UPI002ED4BD8A